MKVVALAGGVGAARFLRGLVLAHPPEDITVIGNTGDDAVIHGLHVSPDLDIISYTLAGIVGDPGWGMRDDTTHALEQMRRYGADIWFTLGDRDLGTHLARTGWLGEGMSLSEVTERIRMGLGVVTPIIPMSNEQVRTKLVTEGGQVRDFQEYFVKFRHSESIREVRFEGAAGARPAPGVEDAIAAADRIVICPSNPVLSIGPILAVPGIRAALAARRQRVFGISPIVQGAALKGPAGRLLPVWGVEPSTRGVAALYADFCGRFILDELDRDQAGKIRRLGVEPLVADTIMRDDTVAKRLAEIVVGRPLAPISPRDDGAGRGTSAAGKGQAGAPHPAASAPGR